jgi:molybdopterin-guanine dinucleotide biosynthesis protein A
LRYILEYHLSVKGHRIMSTLTIAIMAGGKSSRMGTDKSFVPLLGKPMIEHILERVSGLDQDETILITNRPQDYDHLALPMFTDVFPGKGSLGGIYTAIRYSRSEYTFVIACDMPFVNPALMRYMIALRGEREGPYDVIVPRVEGHPQGLHAIYGQACLEPIRSQLDANRLKVIGFYDQVRVRYLDPAEYARLDPDGLALHNINTPEELEAARQLARLKGQNSAAEE